MTHDEKHVRYSLPGHTATAISILQDPVALFPPPISISPQAEHARGEENATQKMKKPDITI